MIWNDATSWIDTAIWSDAGGLDVITQIETALSRAMPSDKNLHEYTDAVLPCNVTGGGDISADTELEEFIPALVLVDRIVVINSKVNRGQISGGTTTDGFELFTSAAIAASGATVITVNKYISTLSSLFLHDAGGGDTWNSMNIDIHLIYWKL